MDHARAAAAAVASSQPPTPHILPSIHPWSPPPPSCHHHPQSKPPPSPGTRQCCMTGQTHSPSAGQILLQLPRLFQRGSDLVSPGRENIVPPFALVITPSQYSIFELFWYFPPLRFKQYSHNPQGAQFRVELLPEEGSNVVQMLFNCVTVTSYIWKQISIQSVHRIGKMDCTYIALFWHHSGTPGCFTMATHSHTNGGCRHGRHWSAI